MSSRKSNDNTSANGVNFTAGSGASTTVIKNVNYSQNVDTTRLLIKNGAFNGNPVEVYADNAVWDTVNNKYLFPGTDFNPGDLQKK